MWVFALSLAACSGRIGGFDPDAAAPDAAGSGTLGGAGAGEVAVPETGAPGEDAAAPLGPDVADGAPPPSCRNVTRDPGETDIDCGGPCTPCATGLKCGGDGDCLSDVCRFGLCRDPGCSDDHRNQGESDVDCGGPCEPCADGRACGHGADCQSGYCALNVCAVPAASCGDGQHNGTETDSDCGGGGCPACATDAKCAEHTDCLSLTCLFGLCRDPTCHDTLKNGSETDVDCGGACSGGCADGRVCKVPGDCASGRCQPVGVDLSGAPVGLCVSCSDGTKNGGETGTDCGGPCPACGDGGTCSSSADCASGTCVGGQCVSCSDGKKNGGESDTDCGGPCAPCGEGGSCGSASDCATVANAKLLCISAKCTRHFTAFGDGTVRDNTTALRWLASFPSAGVEGQTMLWSSAQKTCGALTTGGKTTWRLPSVLELRSLINPTGCPETALGGACHVGATCFQDFPTCTGDCNCSSAGCANYPDFPAPCAAVWSSDKVVGYQVNAYWTVWSSGFINPAPASDSLRVRCVATD